MLIAKIRVASIRSCNALLLSLGLFGAAPASFAGIIEDSITLSTQDQSMWEAGSASRLSAETFLGTKWGTYDGGSAERLPLGGIAGEENYRVPGTGGTIPNPARIAWDIAMAACPFSRSTCISGSSAVRACAPSWLGGGCTTVIPAIPGLGSAPPANIDNPIPGQFIDTRTGLEGGIETSGEAGIIPWVEATAGEIDIDLDFDASIEVPDVIDRGDTFTISTSVNVLDGSTIAAEAPSFKAGVDGIFNSDNELFGKACIILAGCAEDSVEADVKPGRFGIVSIDTSEDNFLRMFGGERGENSIGVPGIAFDDIQIFYAPTPENPDGVDDDVTPKKIPSPRLGDFTVSNPEDREGGVVSDNKLALTTNQQLLSLNASITGIGELALGSPGILSNKIEIVSPIALEYTILDVAAGPRLGVQQDFSIDPNAYVRLEFDQPVVQRLPDQIVRVPRTILTRVCVSSFLGFCFEYKNIERTVFDLVTVPGELVETNVVEIALGDSIDLSFADQIGSIINREYFLLDPSFSNRTGATLDPGLKLEIGCIGIDIITSDRFCAVEEDFKTTGLININVFDSTWVMDGFNTLAFADAITFDQTRGVPEPGTLLLLAIGLVLLSFNSQWMRSKT